MVNQNNSEKISKAMNKTNQTIQTIPFNISNYSTSTLLIYGLLLFILLLGLIIFMIYPTKLLLYSYVPFTILYLLITFSVFIYIIIYVTKRNDSISFVEFLNSFGKHSIKFLIVVGIFLAISVVFYFIFSGFKKMFTFLLSYSLWYSLGLMIIILSILNQYTYKYSFNSKYVNLIKNIILYIPCILSDTIDYLKKDYDNTPSTVMILFVILVIYILMYFIIPLIYSFFYKYDGLLLVNKPVYLNTNVLTKSKQELYEDIFNNRPFYDRWAQQILNKTDLFNQAQTESNDISYNFIDSDNNNSTTSTNNYYNIIPDNITKGFYESFTTAQNNDSIVITNSLNFLNLTQQNLMKKIMYQNPDIENKVNELSKQPENLKEYVLSIIYDNPQLMSIYDKIMMIVDNTKSFGVAAAGIPNDLTGSYLFDNNLQGNLFHYGISFWIYINSNNINGKNIILKYGNRPSLFYNGDTKELTLEINNNKNRVTSGYNDKNVIYKTNSILYQRWNHIVMNYNYGSFDLFINNNLVGSYNNIVPKMYDDDLLFVGSKNNSNLGGICNMKYYELPIPLNKIEKIYSQFHKKNPPI